MRANLKGIIAILAIELLLFLTMDLFLSGFPIFLTNQGYAEHLVGVLFGVFGVSAIIFRPFLAAFGNRYGQKWILLLGAFVAVTAPLLYMMVSQVWLLLLVRAYHGLVPATFLTATQLLLMAQCGEDKKNLGIGLYGIAGGISLLIGPYLGVYLLLNYGSVIWLGTAIFMGIASLIIGLYVCKNIKEVTLTLDASIAKFNPQTVVVPVLVQFGMALGFGAVLTFISTFALKIGYTNPGQYFSLLALITISTRICFSLWGNRVTPRALLVPAGFCLVIGLAILALLPNVTWMMLSAVPIGLGFFISNAVLVIYVSEQVPLQHRSMATAYLVNAIDLGFGLSSITLGFVINLWSYQGMYLLASSFALIAFLLIVFKLPSVAHKYQERRVSV